MQALPNVSAPRRGFERTKSIFYRRAQMCAMRTAVNQLQHVRQDLTVAERYEYLYLNVHT